MLGLKDGQLRVQRGLASTPYALQMYDDELDVWLTLAQADVEEDAMRAGIPVLRGPYVVNWTDIPHDGDAMTLWTPEVGDVLLQLFPDLNTVVQWDQGRLYIGQGSGLSEGLSRIAVGTNGNIGGLESDENVLDSITDAVIAGASDSAGAAFKVTARVFTTNDPVRIQLGQIVDTDPTQGHVELYTLVTRAVAP